MEVAKLRREESGFRPQMDGEPEDALVLVETPEEAVAVVMPTTTVGLENVLSSKSTSLRLAARLAEEKGMMNN